MSNEVTAVQAKETIKKIHSVWYDGDFLKDPALAIAMHRHMEVLFNFAGIEETLVENNPDKITPTQVEEWSNPEGKCVCNHQGFCKWCG